MARSVQEIFDSMMTKKEEVAELATLSEEKDIKDALEGVDIDNNSKYSIWRLVAYVVAYVIHIHEVIFDTHKAEVERMILTAKVHTKEWYAEKMLQYQHGDTLLFNLETKQPYYDTIDDSKQIISNVSVSGNGYAIVKLKGESGALTEAERSGAEAYLRDIAEPGAQLAVVSLPSDKLSLTAKLYYEPEFDVNVIAPAVQQVVINYIQNLPFNGMFQVSDMVNLVKQVEGVTDFYPQVIQARSETGTYAPVEARYYPASGWMEIETYNITNIADV
ncbi:hypothetical protein [Algivirga pacifica]|uniref:Baseplate protein J-like domain-containing protein n=1 Tax=Algivirga pacifica TaxID=1162670 RepID=A0ABP9D490_9BACT